MTILDKLRALAEQLRRGTDEQRAPQPGNGAVIHNSLGNADFDGLPGNELPPRKELPEESLFPRKRAAD